MLYHGLTIANAVGQAALFSTSQISISTSCTRSIRLKLPHSPKLLQLITVDLLVGLADVLEDPRLHTMRFASGAAAKDMS